MRVVILTVGAMLACPGGLEAQRAQAVDPVCEQVLPVETLERISHRENLHLVPRMAISGAAGTCNYAMDGTTMLVMMTIGAPAQAKSESYQGYQRLAAYRKNQRKVSRLGDAAFTSGDFSQNIVVKRETRVLVVSAFYEFDETSHALRGAYLTRDQVIQVARGVIGKMWGP